MRPIASLSLAMVVAAAHLTIPPPAEAAPARKDCQLEQYASLDLQVDDGVYLPVSIDGHAGYMSLMLGSALSAVFPHVVGALGLPTHGISAFVYFDEVRATTAADYKTLTLGGANFGSDSRVRQRLSAARGS